MHDRLETIWDRFPVPEYHVAFHRAHRLIVLAGLGRGEEASQGAKAILAEWPFMAEAGAANAFGLLAAGQRMEAVRVMLAVTEGKAGAGLTYIATRFYRGVGMSYRADGNMGLARWSLQNAVDLSSDPVAARHLEEIDAEYQELYVSLERARARRPDDRAVRLQLAELNGRYGRFLEADHQYRELLRRARPPELLFSYARWFHETREAPESRAAAAAIYREILATSPDWERAKVEERLRIVTEK